MAAFYKKKRFWGSLIAVALLAYSFKDIRLDDLQELSTRLNLWFLIPALLISVVMQGMRGVRWRTIVEPGKRIKLVRAVPLYAAGAAINFMMPALTGQVGRMLLFSRKEGLAKALIFSTFLVEIVFDALMLIAFIFVSSLWFVYPEEYRSFSYVVAVSAVTLVILLYLQLAFRQRVQRICKRFVRPRWPGLYFTLMRFTLSFSRGVEALRSSAHLAQSTLYSIIIWVTHAFAVYALFIAFGMDLPIAASIVIVVVNTLALLVPITPGNAGTFELVVIATLSVGFGVSKTDAALYAVALHIIDVLPFFVLSVPFMRAEKVSLTEISVDEEQADEEVAVVTTDPTLVMESESK